MISKPKALLLSLALTPLISFAQCKIEVKDAYVLGGMPGQKNTAGYAHFYNTGKEVCHLKAAHSNIAERVELHTIQQKDNRMKMVQVDHFTIAPHSELALAKGGNHLMFIGVKDKELKTGNKVKVELVFDKDQKETVEFTVKEMKESHSGHH